jgi:hypothetical protein
MSKIRLVFMLSLLVAVVAPLSFLNGADKLKNRTNKDWFWVARRHEDDPHVGKGTFTEGHIAYAVKIDANSAKLWAYNAVKKKSGSDEWQYVKVPGDVYPLILIEINNLPGTGDLLRREQSIFQRQIGGKTHTLGVALNKRAVNKKGQKKGKAKGFPHQRVIMHYTIRDTSDKTGFVCPPIPEDDVLEEEEVTDPADLDYPDP